jgi:hypothetical protein
MMITQETQEFLDRFNLLKDNRPTSYVIVLLMAIRVLVCRCQTCPNLLFMSFGVPLPLLLYLRG